jgi:hypothetical protein
MDPESGPENISQAGSRLQWANSHSSEASDFEISVPQSQTLTQSMGIEPCMHNLTEISLRLTKPDSTNLKLYLDKHYICSSNLMNLQKTCICSFLS